MAKMSIALPGSDFRALSSATCVPLLFELLLRDRLGETRPARPAIKFIQRSEEGLAANDVDVNTGFVVVPIRILKRRLRPTLHGHVILLFRQPFPQIGLGCSLVAGSTLDSGRLLSFFLISHNTDKNEERGPNCKKRQARDEERTGMFSNLGERGTRRLLWSASGVAEKEL